MAEAALLGVANSVLGQLSSPALKEVLLLWNFDKDLNRLRQTIRTITAFLHDAEQRESKEESVKLWLSRLRAILYDADDLFDAIAARALQKHVMPGNKFNKEVRLFFSKSNQLGFVCKTTRNIKTIRERLDDINHDMVPFNFQSLKVEENFPLMKNLNRETHSFVDAENVIGRDEEKEEIISLLLSDKTSHRKLSVISIIGFGGLGKTTLAQLVYNDDRVQNGFDLRLWVCINYFSDLKSVLVTILTAALKSKPEDLNLDQLQEMLTESINGKKMLLVLDDVWEEGASKWAKLETLLNCGQRGSKVLATTRNTEVAKCLHSIAYQLRTLSKERAWDLFAKSTFQEDEVIDDSELVRLGEQIVHKCGYVPLAIITVGSMLRFKEKDKKTWLSMVDNELAVVLADNKDDQIMKVLMISYNGLPLPLKHCFAYCSIFPKGYHFDKDELVRMWVAQGFIEPQATKSLEEVADVYFFQMAYRCFFQDVVRDTSEGYPRDTCKMHDLLHDLAIKVAGMESRCFIRGDLERMGGGSSLRHISIKCDPKFLFDPFVLSPHSKMVRTFILGDAENFRTSFLNSVLGCFKMLRALELPFLDVDMLPDSFGGLIHLRYLDLSNSRKLKKIPNSICKLQYLQTLDLRHCKSLVQLPWNIGKLVSLRHLFLNDCESLGSLPSGLAEITTIVSLDRLIVHPSSGGLRYLGRLDDLCGAVKIELPVMGWSDCIEDARKSNMSKKHKLHGMIINWIDDDEQHETTKEEATGTVLEAIQPHENLQYLSIKGYPGDKLSSWVFSLPNLKELSLYECTLEYLYHENVKVKSLLPCLEVLKMESLPNLKGWWPRDVAFPSDLSRVSKVSISDCPNLVEGMPLFRGIEELNLRNVNVTLVSTLLSTRTPNLAEITLMLVEELSCVPKDLIKFSTCLKSLKILGCRDLRWVSSSGLANLAALEELEISYHGNVKLEDNDEDHAENKEILGKPWTGLKRLRRLKVPWQRHLQGGLRYLTALEELQISYYENEQVEEDNEMMEKNGLNLTALETLVVEFNRMLYSCFPKWIQHLRFLKELEFTNCVELSMSWALLASMKLQQLSFSFVEKVVSVDEMEAEQQIQFNSLINLYLFFTEDGSWIHDIPWKLFQSLRTIYLWEVQTLKKIPEGFKQLTSLQNLSISGGLYYPTPPEIADRCKPGTGEDWHLISHIPTIYIMWRDEAGETRKISVKQGSQ